MRGDIGVVYETSMFCSCDTNLDCAGETQKVDDNTFILFLHCRECGKTYIVEFEPNLKLLD